MPIALLATAVLASPLGLASLAAATLAAPAAVPPAPALPAIESMRAADRIRATAAREGFAVFVVMPVAPGRLVVGTRGLTDREAFLRKASLVAYAASQATDPPEEIAFEHLDGDRRLSCRVRAEDLRAYLGDRITKAAYQQRMAYQVGAVPPPPAADPGPAVPRIAGARRPQPVAAPAAAAVALPAVPAAAAALPALPTLPKVRPEPPRPRPIEVPVVARPAPAAPAGLDLPAFSAPRLDGEWRFGYGMGLGKGSYDALQLEYGHPLGPALELRPAVWVVSGLSPLNHFAGSAAIEGVSGAIDLVGTTRRQIDAHGLSLEGGLGVRGATLQSAGAGALWPAMHLRVGARWHALAVGMRYPLLTRAGDPTATWEATAGLAWSFGP